MTILLAAGCANLDYDPVVGWQAQITTTTELALSGTAAAGTRGGSTFEAGIDLSSPVSGSFGWEIARGTCAAPGIRVGGLASYPNILVTLSEIDVIGHGRVENTVVNAELNRRGRYHARVVDVADRDRMLACGNLERVAG